MPKMSAIDMRCEDVASGTWVSPSLRDAIADRIEKGEQSLIFLNRRGYAPITLCRACGNQIGCDQCDARMVEHRFLKRLMCHQCGETKPMPTVCPSCEAEDRLAAVGPGVRAERFATPPHPVYLPARLAQQLAASIEMSAPLRASQTPATQDPHQSRRPRSGSENCAPWQPAVSR